MALKNILIGSGAIAYHFKDFRRVPKDLDYIGSGQNVARQIEYLPNPVFENYEHDVMLPDDLYTLKISHLFWDINWSKHMYDVQFLRSKGCKLKHDLFDKLYAYWNEYHGSVKRSNLNMKAEDFFDNAMTVYDHDALHFLLNPNPTYKKVLKNDAEVDVDEQKFLNLSHQEKLDLVYEEVYVMAYERLHNRSYREAYHWMLKKFIMFHAPIWEALFIIEHYVELHKPKINYVELLNNKLKDNTYGFQKFKKQSS